MYGPNVSPDEDIERELVSSSREWSEGFVPFASLDPTWALGQITRGQPRVQRPLVIARRPSHQGRSPSGWPTEEVRLLVDRDCTKRLADFRTDP